jgi:pimeloyl-ACP methyl ester carboxylesterase
MLTALADGLFAEQFGNLPARVIALPGWMRKRDDFRLVLDGLDALAIDLPGFGGASPQPSSAGGASHYADLVEPALSHASERCVVLGHAFGGRVAVHLAARYPDRVKGIVLTGVPLLHRDDRAAPSVPIVHRVSRWAHRRGLLSDARMEARRRRSGSADYRASSGIMRDVLVIAVNESYEPELRTVAGGSQRVELVWGADDVDVPVRTAERAQSILGHNASLRVIDGIGHLVPLESPTSLRASVERLVGAL